MPQSSAHLAAAIGVIIALLGNTVIAEQPRNPFLSPQAEDLGWPHVRGNNYDGHSAEIHLADSWPAEGPPVLWARKLGQGYSGFVCRGERVYTQYQDLGGQYVVCLHATTGETIWQYRYDWPFDPTGMYPGPRATPTLAGDRVYFAAPNGLVGCLDELGQLQWSKNPKVEFHGDGSTDFGCAASPTIIDGKLIVPVGGKGASVVALDIRDGSLVWKSGNDPASYSSPLPIEWNGRKQVVCYLQNAITSYDVKTGEKLWRMTISHGYDEHSTWPIFHEGLLWISGPFRSGSRLLKVPEVAGNVETIWDRPILSNDVASSVLVDGCIYGFDLRDVQTKVHRPSRGTFRCLDFLTGEERGAAIEADGRNTTSTDGPMIGHPSVIVADGKLILLSDTGELILLRVNPEQCEELVRHEILGGEIVWTAPALNRGCVYVRNHSRAVCVYVGRNDLLEGQLAKRATTVAETRPAANWNLALLLGAEPEYAFDVPSVVWLRKWFAVSLLLLIAPLSLALGLNTILRQKFSEKLWPQLRAAALACALLLGLVGTTILSLWHGEFIFTWPLVLFVCFQWTVDKLRIDRHPENTASEWLSCAMLLVFATTCAGYFFLCRRLSLATEWVFLSGFMAASPVCVMAKRLQRRQRFPPWLDVLVVSLAFTAFYWGSITVLAWKYELI